MDVAETLIRKYCAYQERSHFEVRMKLISLQVYGDRLEEMIMKLIEEDYLNEERFVRAFVSGKTNIKKWGRIKIRAALQQKKVHGRLIDKVLQEIDADLYLNNLHNLLLKRMSTGTQELYRYAQTKGYEFALIQEVLLKIKTENSGLYV
jgi:regulatory protein